MSCWQRALLAVAMGWVACAGACGPSPSAPPPSPPAARLLPWPVETAALASSFAPMPRPPSELLTPLQGRVASLMAAWGPSYACTAFDYFPLGGLQNLWCHRPPDFSVDALGQLAGVDVLLGKTGGGGNVSPGQRFDFARYNPAFVRWLAREITPRAPDAPLRQVTQEPYDASFRPLVTIAWKTLAKLRHDPDCFHRELSLYQDQLTRRSLPAGYYERWFYFMNPFFCGRPPKGDDSFYFENAMDGGVDGNVTKSLVGFWLRRSIDGTRDDFAAALEHVIAAYQPELSSFGAHPPDGAAIARALDVAARDSVDCKASGAAQANVFVSVVFSPDGSAKASVARPPSGVNTACVVRHFEADRVPAFEGDPLRFDRAVKL